MTILADKIALITGGSRGIGAAIAKKFASLGAHVIIVARSGNDLEKIDDHINAEGIGSCTIVTLDLSEHSKIIELAKIIADRYQRLDILVGNAAMLGGLTPINHLADDVFNKIIAVNLTANWYLIKYFDALLRNSPAGRAMFVTSGIAQHLQPFWGAYATSKAGLEAMVKTYAAETAHTNLKVNLVDPGIVATRMRYEAMPGENQDALKKPDEITEKFVQFVI